MRPTVVRVPPYSVMAHTPGGLPATHVHHCFVVTPSYTRSALYRPSLKYWRQVTGNPSDIQMSHKSVSFCCTASPFMHFCQFETSNGIRRHLDSCIRVPPLPDGSRWIRVPPLPTLPWARLTQSAGRDAMISGYTHL